MVECLPHKHETLYLSHNCREKKWGGKLGGSRRRKRRGKKRREVVDEGERKRKSQID